MASATNPSKTGIGKTVLVVDDSAQIRGMLSQAFLADGFRTCGQAENGRDAIETAKKLQPDVIVLDLSMPVMNGLEAAPHLRNILPHTPIILFTLYTESIVRAKAAQSGVDLVLLKTVPLPLLVHEARQLIDH